MDVFIISQFLEYCFIIDILIMIFLIQFVCMLCILRVSCESVWHGAGNEPLDIVFLFMHLICLLLPILLC